MSQDLIIVKQLPIIEERLKTIKAQIEARTQEALSLACTENTVKEIKKVRAELSKDFKELEAQRKAVKSKVLSPYEQFEAIYKACVTDVYAPADAELKSRIDEIEDAIKDEKREKVVAYFGEYAKSKGIGFLEIDRAGIQITLAASEKSLKSSAKKFIDRIEEELALIETQEHKEEVLVEYKQSLNVANAITLVTRRHEAIEAEHKRMEEDRIAREQREAANRKIASVVAEDIALAPPKDNGSDDSPPLNTPEAVPAEKTFYVSFTVRGTREKLKTLKEFLENGGFAYESF